MQDVKVVIGANFGDEGKGLMTDYFAHKAMKEEKKCVVVCCNGGSQRGHTVVTPEGKRFVFHHFGSGVFAGADTYLPKQFIANPINFRKEYEELQRNNIKPTQTFFSDECKITTPFEMILNCIIEDSRGENRHGSCGCGIYETILRDKFIRFTVKNASDMDLDKLKDILLVIRDEYIPKRLRELNITNIGKFKDILYSDSLIYNFIDNLFFMLAEDRFHLSLHHYQNVIFECGQGLLLDKSNTLYAPNLTPSNTGSINPINILSAHSFNKFNVEVCYVTRSYMTRHGAGRFDTECKPEDIGIKNSDKTNVTNEYQGKLRYGYLDDSNSFLDRITKDSVIWETSNNAYYAKSIAITHLDETEGKLMQQNKDDKILEMANYFSYGETRNDIKTK